MPTHTKKCKVCEVTKDARLFYEGRRVCQECYRSRQTGYYREHSDHIKARVLALYHAQKK